MAPEGTGLSVTGEAPSEMMEDAAAASAPAMFQNCSTATLLPPPLPGELVMMPMSASLACTSFLRVIYVGNEPPPAQVKSGPAIRLRQ